MTLATHSGNRRRRCVCVQRAYVSTSTCPRATGARGAPAEVLRRARYSTSSDGRSGAPALLRPADRCSAAAGRDALPPPPHRRCCCRRRRAGAPHGAAEHLSRGRAGDWWHAVLLPAVAAAARATTMEATPPCPSATAPAAPRKRWLRKKRRGWHWSARCTVCESGLDLREQRACIATKRCINMKSSGSPTGMGDRKARPSRLRL